MSDDLKKSLECLRSVGLKPAQTGVIWHPEIQRLRDRMVLLERVADAARAILLQAGWREKAALADALKVLDAGEAKG